MWSCDFQVTLCNCRLLSSTELLRDIVQRALLHVLDALPVPNLPLKVEVPLEQKLHALGVEVQVRSSLQQRPGAVGIALLDLLVDVGAPNIGALGIVPQDRLEHGPTALNRPLPNLQQRSLHQHLDVLALRQ